MAEREGAVASGPPAPVVPADPVLPKPSAEPPGVTGGGSPLVQGPRQAEQSTFFDEPVRRPVELEDQSTESDGRITLDGSAAEVVAGAQARTTQLRAALDDLRRVLDDADVAAAAPRRRRLPVVALTGGLAAVVAAGLLVNHQLGADGSTDAVAAVQPSTGTTPTGPIAIGVTPPTAAASGSPTSPTPAGVSPSSTAPLGSVTSAPVAPATLALPAGVPADGPGITGPGVTAVAAIDPATGTVDVYEQYTSAAPADALSLRLPLPRTLLGPVSRLVPAVQDLTVTLDGQPARAVPAGERTWVAAPAGGSRYTRATVRYRLTGALVLSAPSTRGRGFIVVGPLTGDAGLRQQLPVQLRVAGPAARTISCPLGPDPLAVCQTPDGAVRTASLPAGSTEPLFLLQVDLPKVS